MIWLILKITTIYNRLLKNILLIYIKLHKNHKYKRYEFECHSFDKLHGDYNYYSNLFQPRDIGHHYVLNLGRNRKDIKTLTTFIDNLFYSKSWSINNPVNLIYTIDNNHLELLNEVTNNFFLRLESNLKMLYTLRKERRNLKNDLIFGCENFEYVTNTKRRIGTLSYWIKNTKMLIKSEKNILKWFIKNI